jgi:hypothetical protein
MGIGCRPASITPLALATAMALALEAIAQDRTEAALAALDPRFAHAAWIVPRHGDAIVRLVGPLEDGIPFARSHLVPLGDATGFLLDAALAVALAEGVIRISDPVIGGEGGSATQLEFGQLDKFFAAPPAKLPGYERFAREPDGLRPIDEVVAAHGLLLERWHRFGDTRTIEAALAQALLERGTREPWAAHLRRSARRFGIGSIVDLGVSWPPRSVAVGRRADAGEWPVRIAEVPSPGNAGCSVDDLVPFVRTLLHDVVGTASDEVATRIPPVRRFTRDTDPDFAIETRRFTSSWCGTTLALELVPDADAAIVWFGARSPGTWEAPSARGTARDASRAGARPARARPALTAGRARPQPAALRGSYRGQVLVDGLAVELELLLDRGRLGLVAPRVRVLDAARSEPVVISGRQASGSLELRPAEEGGLERRLHFDVEGSEAEAEQLAGIAWLERATQDGIRVELLPQRVSFRRAMPAREGRR